MSPEAIRGPVNPAEAAELQTELIPDEVFIAFNGLIARELSGGRARVLQKDVIAELEEVGVPRGEIFKRHMLDVEDSYRATGWQVTYDKPMGYAGETFDAYFEFKAKKE